MTVQLGSVLCYSSASPHGAEVKAQLTSCVQEHFSCFSLQCPIKGLAPDAGKLPLVSQRQHNQSV